MHQENNRSNMQEELERLQTYINWSCTFMEPNSLAKAGFYYINKEDIVRCAFCSIEIGCWVPGENPMAEHQRWSDNCPLVRSRDTSLETPTRVISYIDRDICDKYDIEIRPNAFPDTQSRHNSNKNHNVIALQKFGVHPVRLPAYPRYASLMGRLNTFVNWPSTVKQIPTRLAAAGFFYTGKADQTICFHCGGGLMAWGDDDDPWVQHAAWFQTCPFVSFQKGQEYIRAAYIRHQGALCLNQAANLQSHPISTAARITYTLETRSSDAPVMPDSLSTSEVSKVKELAASENQRPLSVNLLCKICYSEDMSVVFLPCGHIFACVNCACALDRCAICRKPFEASVRAFLS